MNLLRILLLLPMMVMLGCTPAKVDYLNESSEDRDARMEWWREARFGMFIHWGLYAVPAGEWNGTTNHAEWIRTTAQIPLEVYNGFVDQFNPVKFNADEWVNIALDAGMKYIVITSKHHDGFGLFHSKHTDFDVASTPFKRDILKELSDACHREGIRICWYHSIMDWHHPDYLPRREWESDRSSEGANFDRYVSYMNNQLKELLSKYGDIGVLWFDGEWENTWNSDYGKDLYQYVRRLQPDIIINNRVSVGRSGMAGMTREGEFGGDFGTPEQEIPGTGVPGYDWETCMTMNNHWGYNRLDKDFKSSAEILRMLSDIASKGGNFLLNVGPTAEGLFPSESVDRLKEIGVWMKINGESIYGTQASPFTSLPWGRCTRKSMTESTRLYLHVFDWPADGKLVLPGLGNKPIRAYLLADPNQDDQPLTRNQDALIITLPAQAPDPVNSIVVLDIEGDPIVYKSPVIEAFSNKFIDRIQVKLLKGETVSEIRYTLDGTAPGAASNLYTEPIELTASAIIQAACFIDGGQVSGISTATCEQVTPLKGRQLEQAKPGLLFHFYDGSWDSVPAFSGLTPKVTGISDGFKEASNAPDDNFAIDYQGFLDVPETGLYELHLTSDDGSLLYLHEQLIVDNDGLHGAITKSATMALEKGLHPLRISFFERSGGNTLRLEWRTQQSSLTDIPAERYFHYR